MPDTNASALDDLEKLVAQAEQEAKPKLTDAETKEALLGTSSVEDPIQADGSPTLPQPNPTGCNHEGSDIPSRRWCRGCKRSMCQFCWSVIDPNYCSDCMGKVDLKVEQTALVDDEGVTHRGRVLHPNGAFNDLRWIPDGKTTSKAISEMNIAELEEYVEAYKSAVHDAERALDIRRIRLAGGQLELDERKDAERRKLRADKTKYPVKTVTVDAKTGKKTTKTASPAQAMGMLQMLQAMQALKAKIAARTPVADATPNPLAKPEEKKP